MRSFSVKDQRMTEQRMTDAAQDIPRRGQAETMLAGSEEALVALINGHPESLFLMDADGTVIAANKTVVRRLGTSVNELVGSCVYDFLSPDVANRRKACVNEVIRTGNPARLEDMRTDRHVMSCIHPIFNAEGKVTRLAVTSIDVTERVHAEQALQHRLDIEELVGNISAHFVNVAAEELDAQVRRALQAIGQFIEVDRGYLGLLSGDGMKIETEYEWCDEGVEPQSQAMEGMSMAPFRWLMGQVDLAKVVAISRVADLPPEASFEKGLWQARGVQSVLSIPLFQGEKMVGYLGFQSLKGEKRWSEEDSRLLRVVGEVFLNVLARKQAEEELQHAHDQLEGRVEERTAELSQANVRLRQEIAQRGQVEETLLQSEERYRRLVELSPNLIGVAVDHKITFVNTAGAQLLAAESPEQLIGRPITDIVHPDYRQTAGQRIQQMMEEGIGAPLVEEKWLRLDGITIDVAVAAVPFRHQDTPAIQIVAYDITDRKRAEESLRRERDRSQTYLDIAGVMLVALNDKGEITLVNRRGCQVLGYEEDALIGRNWFDTCLPTRVREEVRSVYQRLMAGDMEPSESSENPVLTSSGEERNIAWHNTGLTDEAGTITGILGSGEDITQRKQAESQRDASLEALRESEEKYRLVSENVPVVVYTDLPDERLTCTFVSGREEELIGYPS